jgi:Flp pilus assembly protein TadG
MIEMVVSFIVLFYLVMGGVEFGWFMYAKHVVQSAARDGARQGIIASSTHAQAVAAVNDAMASAGFTDPSAYTITWQEVGPTSSATVTSISQVDPGYGLRCTVSAPFVNFKMNPPLGRIPPNKQITGVTVMVRE